MYRQLLLFLSVIVLSGCAPHFTYYPYVKRQQALKRLTRWQLHGAVRVRYQDKTQAVSLHWQQQGKHELMLRLSGPLGIAAVVFKETSSGVTFQRDNQVLRASSLQALMSEQLGWSLPADDLYYWVRGLPAPGLGQAQMKFDRFGHLTYLKQGRWSLVFGRYVKQGAVDLPTDIQLWSSKLQLRLVVSAWSLKATSTSTVSQSDLDLLKSVP